LAEEKAVEARYWPKGLCAGLWRREIACNIGTGKRGRARKGYVEVPHDMYSKGRDIWAGLPRFKAKIRPKGRNNGEIEIVGTLRAAGCRYFTSRRSGFDDNTCAQCAGLLHDKSFKKALLQSVKDSGGPVDMEMVDDYSMDTHNTKLRRDQLEHKAALIAAELHEATTELRNTKVALERSQANVQELKG